MRLFVTHLRTVFLARQRRCTREVIPSGWRATLRLFSALAFRPGDSSSGFLFGGIKIRIQNCVCRLLLPKAPDAAGRVTGVC